MLFVASANASLSKAGTGAPLLGEPGTNEKLMLVVDSQFRTAAQNGSAELAAYLLGIEDEHFARLKASIQDSGGLVP